MKTILWRCGGALCLLAVAGGASVLGDPVVPGAAVTLFGTLPNGYRPYTVDIGNDPRGFEWGRWLYFGSDNNSTSGVQLTRMSLGTATSGAGQVAGVVHEYSVPVYDPDGILVDRSGGLTGLPGQVLTATSDISQPAGRIWKVDPAGNDAGPGTATVQTYVAPQSALNNCDTMTLDGLGRLYLGVPTFNQIVRMVGLPVNNGGTFEVFANTPAAPGKVAYDGAGGVWGACTDGVLRRYSVEGALPRPVDRAVNTGTGTENGLTWSRVTPGGGGAWGGGMLVVRRGSGNGQLVRVRNNGVIDVLGTGMGDVYAIAVDDDGVLYAADYGDGRVWKIARTERLGCGPADVGGPGGLPLSDGALDNNDFVAFINYFFDEDAVADMGVAGGLTGADGAWDNNDFIAFINLFFEGC